MFSLDDLRQTRVWQEAQQEARLETKLETVPRLQRMGLTVEQIAEALELTVEQVRVYAFYLTGCGLFRVRDRGQ